MSPARLSLALLLGVSLPGAAQEPVRLGRVLSTFLADSGVRTQGLPFTIANALPARWRTPAPVAAPQYMHREGFTLSREGTVMLAIGDRSPFQARVTVWGNQIGVQRFSITIETTANEWTERQILAALPGEGVTLTPLKCDLEKEGASYGNMVYVAKMPGKTASGLAAMWQCPRDGCELHLSILYRRADVQQIECYSGG